ncbi:MAG TPA: MarR family transcriptional regulator [Pseudonocardiaceae bacterium]|nr:MarR family transcriptional regulator [Pseudonocardiaceae bacterium]
MISDSALLALQRATHASLHRLTSELTDLNLTAAEINALANLADGRPRIVSQLAAEVGSRPSTLTSVLDRLEGRGHINRRLALGNDRRAVTIELTESGQIAAATIRQRIAELEDRALREVPADALAGFHQVLRALTGRTHDRVPRVDGRGRRAGATGSAIVSTSS